MEHRGPDDAGAWVEGSHGIGLAHRRLSILDLSAAGHQPMASPSGRFVIVFNGEVYNFEALRHELAPQGFAFNGHSDTEVLLAAFEAWGIEQAVTRFVGMFAFAVWDRREHVLTLGRDRFGVKPLVYALRPEGVWFASDLHALKGTCSFELNHAALGLLLRHNYIPGPHTVFIDTYKVKPGHLVRFWRDEHALQTSETPFWSLADVAQQPNAVFASDMQVIDETDRVARAAVGLRMVSDVPIGAFLSGGVDSSLVVAMMQAQERAPVKTFTIGFTDPRYDEAPHARVVAEHLKTDHHEFYVSPDDVLSAIPLLGRMYDEPFADSSQIPTYLVSKLARRHVTVSLSGDGGDELFGGYALYGRMERAWQWLHRIPVAARAPLGHALMAISERAMLHRGDKLERIGNMLTSTTLPEAYEALVSHHPRPSRLVAGQPLVPSAFQHLHLSSRNAGLRDQLMYMDAHVYLPDDILVKVDRASMAVSLESREPLLDHRLAELAWRLPLHYKVRGGQGKWVLRQVLDRYVPRPLIERPKRGFAVPLAAWLRGPLRAWADDLLTEERLRADGLFDGSKVRRVWKQHLSGQRNAAGLLWSVLMAQQWYKEWRV